MDNNKLDMSKECGFKDAEMWHKCSSGEITQEELNIYWNNYCGKCVYMNEICMCGEELNTIEE